MQIKIKNCRLSFSNLRKPFVPKTGDPKFTFNGICDENTTVEVTVDDKKITIPHTQAQKVIDRICKDKWGKTPAKLEMFLYNRADTQVGSRGPKINEDGDFYDGYTKDTMFFSAGTKAVDAPEGILVVDQHRKVLPASSGHPVNGDYVNAIINAFAYEYEGKKGLSASLEGIQYLRKGEPFGASKIEANAFDEEELEEEDFDVDTTEDDIF